MKFLVTGGCGFIGSNFIRFILGKYNKIKVVNLDRLTYAGNRQNLKDIEGDRRYTFVKGDICNAKLVKRLLAGRIDVLVNFAAQTHVDRSIKDASPFVRTNIEGVRILLDAARSAGVKRFIQISTDEVYGDIKRGFSREGDPLFPNSPYAASKAAADVLCGAYHRTYGLPVIISRSSNNVGPYQYPEKVVPLFITNLMEGKKVPLYGDGKNIRDWIYVEDNCRALDTIIKKGKVGEIYNIGGGNQTRNIQLAQALLKEFGVSRDRIQYVTDRPGHDRRYALNSDKLRGLGFTRCHTVHEALKKTVSWYKNNRWWWAPLKKKAYIIKW